MTRTLTAVVLLAALTACGSSGPSRSNPAPAPATPGAPAVTTPAPTSAPFVGPSLAAPTTTPAPSPSVDEAAAQQKGLAGLKDVSIAEEDYGKTMNAYLPFGGDVPPPLQPFLPDNAQLSSDLVAYGATVRQTNVSFCVVAVLRSSGLAIAYDSAVGRVDPVNAAANDCQILAAQVHAAVS